jgi:hypothetical protein
MTDTGSRTTSGFGKTRRMGTKLARWFATLTRLHQSNGSLRANGTRRRLVTRRDSMDGVAMMVLVVGFPIGRSIGSQGWNGKRDRSTSGSTRGR